MPDPYDNRQIRQYRQQMIAGFHPYDPQEQCGSDGSDSFSDVSSVHDTPNSFTSRQHLARDHPEWNEQLNEQVREWKSHENRNIKMIEIMGRPHPSHTAPEQGVVLAVSFRDAEGNRVGGKHLKPGGWSMANRLYQQRAAADQAYRREVSERRAIERNNMVAHMSDAPPYDMRSSNNSSYGPGSGFSHPGSSWANIAPGLNSLSSGMSYANAAHRPPGYGFPGHGPPGYGPPGYGPPGYGAP